MAVKNSKQSTCRLCGRVVSIKEYDYTDNVGKFEIGIRDDTSTVFCDYLYYKKKVKYGKEKISPKKFMDIFVDEDGHSKGVEVKALGNVYEKSFYNKKSLKVEHYTKPEIYWIYDRYDNDIVANSFSTNGVVEDISIVDDEMRITVGVIGVRYDRESKEAVNCATVMKLKAEGEMIDELAEIQVGYGIDVRGRIVNRASVEYDEYGDPLEDVDKKRGYYIKKIVNVTEYPDVEEYEAFKNKKKEASTQKPIKRETKPVVEDVPDDLDEDVDF